jgi:hypothetical protein
MSRHALAASVVFAPLAALGAIKSESIPELRPPRQEVPAPAIEERHQAWLLAGIGAVLVLVAVCWPRRKPAPPPPDPFTVARRKLAELRKGIADATTVEVSAILRRYAVEAFELQGSALTSEEVITGLALRRACPVDLANAAWRFLSECDVVKFAPGVPPAQMPELLGRADKLLTDMEAARMAAARTL